MKKRITYFSPKQAIGVNQAWIGGPGGGRVFAFTESLSPQDAGWFEYTDTPGTDDGLNFIVPGGAGVGSVGPGYKRASSAGVSVGGVIYETDPTLAASQAADAVGPRFGQVYLAPLASGSAEARLLAVKAVTDANGWPLILLPGTWLFDTSPARIFQPVDHPEQAPTYVAAAAGATLLTTAMTIQAIVNAWTPDSLGVEWAEWTADKGVTRVGKITSVADQVSGRPLTQGTAADQPTYEPTGWNGKPSILFDGTDYLISAAIGALLAGSDVAHTVICCFQETAANVNRVMWSGGANASTTPNWLYGYDGGVRTIWRRADAGDNSGWIHGAAHDTAAHVHIVSFSGTTVSTYIDGEIDINAAACDTTAVTLQTFSVGTQWSNGLSSAPMTGRMAYLAVIMKALSPAEVEQAMGYIGRMGYGPF